MDIQHHEDPWKKMIQPSQLSIFVTVFIVMAIAVATVYFIFVYSSQIAEFLKIGLEYQASANSAQIDAVRVAVDTSQFAANASVFAFWFLVGGLCYLAATTFWHAIVAARWDLESIVTQSYSGKFETLVEIIGRLGLRVLGLALLVGVYYAVIYLVPWFLLWLYQLSSETLSYTDAIIVAMSIAGVALLAHATTVGLRLLLLRVRVFS